MIEVKNDFSGGLNLDDAYFRMGQNSYADALNITKDAVTSNADNIISNLVSNRLIDYTFPAGTNISIGSYTNNLRNTVINFVYNSNGYHSVIEYNLTTRTAQKIFENLTDSDGIDILGFTQYDKLTGINIFNREEGDLLFFLDGIDRPSFMNITLFKAGTYTPVTRQIIDVHKIPPSIPPSAVYDNDNTRTSNFLQKKIFRFKYRWVYDDNFKSTYSPISAIPLPANILNTDFTNVITNNNVISISAQSGPKNVKAVEIAVSIQNSTNVFSRFQTAESLDKEAEGISDNSSFNYNFYNDSTFPYISDRESLLTFDWVPPYAKAQEMPNGNALVYGAIREGYDRTLDPNVTITVNTVAAGDGSTIGNLNGVLSYQYIPLFTFFKILFSGTPVVGTIIKVYVVISAVNTLVGSYTTVAGDTPASVVIALRNNMNSLGLVAAAVGATANELRYDINQNTSGTLEISAPPVSANTNSIATWPFWGQRRLGIVYYDEKGVTNGVLYDANITFPGYAENGTQQVLLPYLNIKIYHVPPDWAYTYQIVFTKDPTQILYIENTAVNKTESSFFYFDITNLGLNAQKNPTTAAVVSWTFQDGDRMRLIRRMSDNTVYGTAYDTAIEGIVSDPTINNVVQTGKTFIKIKNAAPFSTLNFDVDVNNYFIIQLYRPSLQEPTDENATFYECGVEFPILNPTESNRVHGGEISNQSEDYVTPAEFDIYNGDVYFRSRNEVLGQTGIGTFYVQDRNFVDFFISAVSNIDGRPQAIDLNAKETFFPALIRNSQFYEPNTNVNGLNRFYAESLLEVDYSFGDIERFRVRARNLRVYQKLRVGVIYLFSKVGKAPTGNEVTVVTDDLLNPVQYYNFEAGIGDLKESLASFNDNDYFASNITGCIYKLTLEGIIPISVIYKVNSWASEYLPKVGGNSKAYGAYDQKLNNYILSLEATETSAAQTIVFSEEENSFESFISLFPESMCTCRNVLTSFKNGGCWTHDDTSYNTFFGVQYESYLVPIFNLGAGLRKQFMALQEYGNSLWDAPEILTQTFTYGTTNQQSTLVAQEFEQLEGAYATVFKRDQNSPGGKWGGDYLKGTWIKIKLRNQNTANLVTLENVSIRVVNSPLNQS